MNTTIITGASRGLGEAIVKQLLKPDHQIIYLSRSENKELRQHAVENGAVLHFVPCDLSNAAQIEAAIPAIFEKIDWSSADKVTLINNAGTVNPMKPVGKASVSEIEAHVQLNLIAPMVLSNAFAAQTETADTDKVVVNISSGAANNPIYGWNAYCSSKAGLDMFTKAFGLEQRQAKHPVTVLSFSPGIMDTDMQGTIRNSKPEDFAEVARFQEYHETGKLRSADFVAGVLLKLLGGPLENGRVYDIKELI
ncbi:(S)-benzoin forming benzil reductase [Bacillus sp. UMB0893]|uniref:(S)-benzoin forming benzil reductase n=2 Tax=Bacteria TaxID=2 RepID=UPI000C75A2DC|nr:(S)-benzoin forming benzil reductase [Bacillus sp. UMB0893]PLR67053.1 short-chain dehydrogenase [Bacillus sp. UMB0893]